MLQTHSMDQGRRGSGVSITLNRPIGNSSSMEKQMNFGYPPMPTYAAPMYIQSPQYPLLMNPPPIPTYQYGIPPSPYMYGSTPFLTAGDGSPSVAPLRRAGSINAKIMSQDAKRPFQGGGGLVSEANYNNNPWAADEYRYNAIKEADDEGFDKGTIEERSVIDELKKSGEIKQRSFVDKLKFWQTNPTVAVPPGDQTQTQKLYNVRKDDLHDPPPCPGVIIEEMLDSASTHGDHQLERRMETMSVLGQDQFTAALPQRTPVRWRHNTPLNTVVMFVPQQEAWLVERMGKFHRILEPGMNVLIPVVDKVKYVQSLKEIAIDIPQQSAITLDNVTLNIDGILYLRVDDPYKASYGVEDPEFAITQLAQTTMRSEIGKILLDTLFRERENLNSAIVEAINQASEPWGISIMRYEIRDVRMPARVQEAMQMQVEAERKKRAAILESEGLQQAEINIAEGKKQARILASEAEKMELINSSAGQAEAVVAAGRARAQSIELVAQALCSHNGQNAASLAIAEKYVAAFQELAKVNNTLILPANTGDVTGMVAQAMSIYSQLSTKQSPQLQTIPEAEASAEYEVKSSVANPSNK